MTAVIALLERTGDAQRKSLRSCTTSAARSALYQSGPIRATRRPSNSSPRHGSILSQTQIFAARSSRISCQAEESRGGS